jgi:hypothetical protein
MTNIISFVILVFLLIGRRLPRKSPRLHGYWMTAVITADLSLIVYLVFARRALSKISPEMPWYLIVHLGFAISTVLFYIVALIIGWRLLKGYQHPGAMRTLDRFITPTRILTLLTSLLMTYLAAKH